MAAMAANSNGSEVRETTGLKLKEFEGDVCLNCRGPFDSTQSNRITHERLILVGATFRTMSHVRTFVAETGAATIKLWWARPRWKISPSDGTISMIRT